MAASDLNPAVRYSHTLNQTVYILTTAADYNALTRAELDAGVRVDGEIPKDGVSGFSGTEQTITSDDNRTGNSIPLHDGKDWSQGSSINFHLSQTGAVDDIRSVAPENSTRIVVIFDSTDTAGLEMDVFPVRVGSLTKSRSGEAMGTLNFTYTGVPSTDQTVPA